MTGGDTPFTLTFNCTAAKNVRMLMTDAITGSTSDDKLTLSSNSTATGVKLQVLYDDTPIIFNPNSQASSGILLGTSPVGTLSVPLTVRYISTGTATPGSVNAAATFTLSYQ
jgi:type 1 fimbria pilin